MMDTPATMKAVVVKTPGGVDALEWETQYPVPELKEGQLLIKNQYSGLNFIDTYFRTGLYKQTPPFISGQEGGGIIVKLGAGVNAEEFKIGDHVVYMSFGTCCEYSAVPATKVVKLPDGISMEVALACMVQGLTAHYLVTDATAGLIHKGEWCLIYSVGSGTCQWAAQMAKLQGYKVIGTSSKTKTPPTCCDEVIMLDCVEGKTYANYESIDICSRVLEITGGQGVKCIIDGVGLSTSEISVKCLARRGIWISFGNASGAVPPLSLLKFSPKSAFCTRPKLGDYVATPEELKARTNDVFQWIKDGQVDVKIDKVFDLDKAQDAHSYLESGQSKGKILLKI